MPELLVQIPLMRRVRVEKLFQQAASDRDPVLTAVIGMSRELVASVSAGRTEFRATHGLSPIGLGESAPPRPLSITTAMVADWQTPVRYRQSVDG